MNYDIDFIVISLLHNIKVPELLWVYDQFFFLMIYIPQKNVQNVVASLWIVYVSELNVSSSILSNGASAIP